MEFKLIRCSECNRFLGKMRLIRAEPTADFHLELFLYCRDRKCKLARDLDKKGENILEVKIKPKTV